MCVVSRSPSKPCSQEQSRRNFWTVAPSSRLGSMPGQRRRHLARAHVDPDHAVTLLRWVRPRVHLRLEVALRRLRRHVDAITGDIELPAVVNAAQPFFLVASEEQRCAAVRAGVLDDAGGAGGDSETDHVLAQQTQSLRRTVRRSELVRPEGRDPVLAQEVAHQRPWPDAGKDIVVLFGQHGSNSYRPVLCSIAPL